MIDDLDRPVSMAIAGDRANFAIVDARSRFARIYQPHIDGRLEFGQSFYEIWMRGDRDTPGSGNAEYDQLMQLYLPTDVGIQVFGTQGRCDGIIGHPGQLTKRIAFGGSDRQTLFATDGQKIFQRSVRIPGVSIWDDPVLPSERLK